MSKYFRAKQGNKVPKPKAKGSYPPEADKVLEPKAKGSYPPEADKVLEPKAKGSYPPEADKVLEPKAKGSYNREYFEQTTLDLTKNPITNTIKKIIYLSAPMVRALMIKIFLNPKTVLDVGCGKGNLVLWLRRLGIEAYGVDISDYALENAHEPIKRYLSKADTTNLPLKDKSFDLVTTFDLLEHIREGDLPQAIKECQRVADRWVLHKIYGTTGFERRFPVKDPTHVTIKPSRWWQDLFANLKLKPPQKFLLKWEAGIFLLRA